MTSTRNFFFNPNACVGPCAEHVVFPANNGSIIVWGNNSHGQLGLGHRNEVYDLEELTMANERVVATACGFNHTMMITQTGKLIAVGSNDYGKLGIGTGYSNPCLKIQIALLSNVAAVACGKEFSVALLNNGRILSTGNNDDGQLGLGHYAKQFNFCSILLTDVQKICCGEKFAMALTFDGEVNIWGDNNFGQLGLGDTRSRNSPKKMNLPPVFDIGCGRRFGMALTKEFRLYCWGANDLFQLGLSSFDLRFPSPQTLNLSGICSISCGGDFCFAKMVNNTGFYCWGDGSFGQLGNKSKQSVFEPQKHEILYAHDPPNCFGEFVFAEGNHQTYIWGSNVRNQLGNRFLGQGCSTPVTLSSKYYYFLLARFYAGKISTIKKDEPKPDPASEEKVSTSPECPVCLVEFKDNQYVLHCSHSICETCLKEIHECPLCRDKTLDPRRCRV